MTLQQLRYADAIARYGSLGEASRRLFVTQPTLTESIRELEEELRVAIFARSSRGMTVTREGEEFLASARQILDDVASIQSKYGGKAVRIPQFAVSTQHYAFVVEAFMEVVKASPADAYDFTLRETVTSEIIDDVSRHKSEIGVLYLSDRNSKPLNQIFRKEDLVFTELFVCKPHVFVGKKHPFAKCAAVEPKELDDYPFLSFEQGENNSLYFAEEVMPAIDRKKNIRVRDRATMTNLILGLNGYTVASNAVSRALNGPDVVAVPLNYPHTIHVGTLTRRNTSLSRPGKTFMEALRRRVEPFSGKE